MSNNNLSEKKRKVLNAPIEQPVTGEEVSPVDTESTSVPVAGEWESGSKEVSKSVKDKDTLKHNQELLSQLTPPQTNSSHPGNPGQQARFNHVMDNRGPETSKYFK